MRTFIYRNTTIENLFTELNADYSGYGDIVMPGEHYERIFWFYTLPFKVKRKDLVNEVDNYLHKLDLILSRKETKTPIYCFTLQNFVNQINWTNIDNNLQQAIFNFNSHLYKLASQDSSIKVIDIQDFCNKYKISEIFDWRFYYMTETTISPRLGKEFYKWFLKKEKAILQKRKKCLVLDLDNTMWGGVLGEDGIEGIKLGDTYPGNVFLDFQRCVIEASKNGVILAVCSKNNEIDVLEAWKKHPFMQISKDVVSSYRINWNDKATNIAEISEELNIGLDSFVFIDDNPIERERVKQFLPEVTVPDFPKNTFGLIPFFDEIYENNFQAYSLTDEDKTKTNQYAENFKRKKHQQNFENIEGYYKSLEMKLKVHENNRILVSRLSQMTQKTNQFNLTTKRYSEEDIKRFMDDGFVLSLDVKDKFGNNGITVLAIIKKQDKETAAIDSFLLSCRILGRDIEMAFMAYIHNYLFEKGFKEIKADYIPSSKNKKLTSQFLDKCGFEIENAGSDGSKNYISRITGRKKIKEYYQFI